jgi:hypothetical protein
VNDEGRLHSAPAANLDSPGADDSTRRGHIPPTLVIAFELERPPRALNAHDLTEGDLRRLIDWITSHDGGRLRLEEWLEWHLVVRGIREAA